MCGEICTDNRFEVIENCKAILLNSTNIDKSPEELKVLDNILFRMWQCCLIDERKCYEYRWAKEFIKSNDD